MKRRISIEEALSQIEAMLAKIQASGGSAKITQETIDGINQVKALVDQMKTNEFSMVEKLSEDIETLTEQVKNNPALSEIQTKILEKGEAIKSHGKKMLEKYEASARRQAGEKKENKEALSKERRKLFKPLGGDKNWIPM